MSRVYICDVCNNVKKAYQLNEFTRTYTEITLFATSKKTDTIHICKDCWDRIKKEQRGEEVTNESKEIS